MDLGQGAATRSRHRGLVVGIFVLFLLPALLFLFLIPPGEAPDEPAHLAYVGYLLDHGRLPPVRATNPWVDYEDFQPPLAYLVMALGDRLLGFDSITYRFDPNPDFAGGGGGARAYLRPQPSAAAAHARHAVWAARMPNLLWGALCAAATLLLCLRLGRSRWSALAAGAPFCLSPQLLFASATASNDALVAAGSAVALAISIGLLLREPRGRGALVAATGAGCGLLAKASAVVLAPGLALVAVLMAMRRKWRIVAALIIPGVISVAVFVGLSLARSRSFLDLTARGWHGHPAGFERLVSEPYWLLQIWVGFWAKLGWNNLRLPLGAYLLFLPATLLAVAGAAEAFGRRSEHSTAARMLLLTVGSNVALLAVYMASVDWQPQGRLLLPSLPALAGLAVIGLDALERRWPRVRVGAGLASTSLAMALTAVVIASAALQSAYCG
ncbi:MAG TPA: DUF2142 domain-containing protein [Thermoanaerobaculia bacterium]|nr:DUF2142 domain-containing protein [Thermoanaerobaculia bacterium]